MKSQRSRGAAGDLVPSSNSAEKRTLHPAAARPGIQLGPPVTQWPSAPSQITTGM